jgi:DNA-binding CsgD family transcriptional regulator
MLPDLFEQLVGGRGVRSSRNKGAAFLSAARDLYQLSGLAYLGINIPVAGKSPRYTHCCYSDASVTSITGSARLDASRLDELGLMEGMIDWDGNGLSARLEPAGTPDSQDRLLTFPLPSRHQEAALFGIRAASAARQWEEKKTDILREVRILADYLHSHVLRTNGHDANRQLIVSARELDCLRWTAAGKSAWEASVILGISERTVRFHLNAAREKLDCTTTVQAVAKAISHRLIEI